MIINKVASLTTSTKTSINKHKHSSKTLEKSYSSKMTKSWSSIIAWLAATLSKLSRATFWGQTKFH